MARLLMARGHEVLVVSRPPRKPNVRDVLRQPKSRDRSARTPIGGSRGEREAPDGRRGVTAGVEEAADLPDEAASAFDIAAAAQDSAKVEAYKQEAAKGNVAAYTGPRATTWAGDKQIQHGSAQGNILAGPDVVNRMVEAFEKRVACPDKLSRWAGKPALRKE